MLKSTMPRILVASVLLVAAYAAISDSVQSASGVYLGLPAEADAVLMTNADSIHAVQYISKSLPLTPLKQIRDMVPADEVACDDHRTLMLSPSGMPACVFTESTKALERRGFAPPPEVPCGDLSTKQSEALEKAKMTGGSDAANTGDRPFVTTWKVISPNESITIPVGNAAGAYTINWGDGSTSAHVTGDQTHVYCDAGTYTVVLATAIRSL